MNIDLADFIGSFVKNLVEEELNLQKDALIKKMEEQEKEHVKKQTHYSQIRNSLSAYADENRHMKSFLKKLPNLLESTSRQITNYCSDERYIFVKEHGKWKRKDDIEKNRERRFLQELANDLYEESRSALSVLGDVDKNPDDREI